MTLRKAPSPALLFHWVGDFVTGRKAVVTGWYVLLCVLLLTTNRIIIVLVIITLSLMKSCHSIRLKCATFTRGQWALAFSVLSRQRHFPFFSVPPSP